MVDYNSRFYTEDIPFGLAAIHSLGMLADVTTPNIDRIIRWYSAIAGKEYIKADGSLGKDANETATLQVHGITNIKSLIEFYEK